MSTLSRRTFVQLSAGALVTASSGKLPAQAPTIASKDGKVRASGPAYAWEYTQGDDSFRILDAQGRSIVSGKMQPSVVVAPSGTPTARTCMQGKATAARVEDGKVRLTYEGVNGAGRLNVAWRFDEHGAWMEPIEYESAADEDVVSVHYFAYPDGVKHTPSLYATYLVVPGVSEGSAVSPILNQIVHLDDSVWLGRGSFTPGLFQAWGLPVHYFCGFSVAQVMAGEDRRMGTAAPQDKRYGGERLLLKGIEIVVKAMRQENPDIVVMYYNLSPLFIEYFDLHAPDDLFMVEGEYDLEANRRIYFSSLMGTLSVSTYGSSGYDWASSPSIWFDSAASGSIGSLNDFLQDEEGEGATPELIARYNGVAKTLRPTGVFEVVPLGEVSLAPTRGAHARSWARLEGGQLVLMAYRRDPAGEPDALASRSSDARIRDAVSAPAPVIVSSKTPEGIARSSRLAVVAYGDGPVVVRRQSGRRAQSVTILAVRRAVGRVRFERASWSWMWCSAMRRVSHWSGWTW